MPKIAAGATNKNISIAPHGTGKVVVGTDAADATVQSDGDHNLILQTGNSTTSKIEITDGANGDVAITPNGTGNLTIDNIAISDNTIISTDTNGNIDLTPDGTGEVNISKVDIDGGAIDGTNVTVGSGKTLDVSAGTLTSSTAQKQAIIDGASIEGTAVDSTGESGGTKFLREDGDGTSSWQTASGSDSLPSQTGYADRLLTTNGSAASWTNAPINLVKLAFAGQSSAPGAPSAGTAYYNSTTNKLSVYNGTAWIVLNEPAGSVLDIEYIEDADTTDRSTTNNTALGVSIGWGFTITHAGASKIHITVYLPYQTGISSGGDTGFSIHLISHTSGSVPAAGTVVTDVTGYAEVAMSRLGSGYNYLGPHPTLYSYAPGGADKDFFVSISNLHSGPTATVAKTNAVDRPRALVIKEA